MSDKLKLRLDEVSNIFNSTGDYDKDINTLNKLISSNLHTNVNDILEKFIKQITRARDTAKYRKNVKSKKSNLQMFVDKRDIEAFDKFVNKMNCKRPIIFSILSELLINDSEIQEKVIDIYNSKVPRKKRINIQEKF